MTGTPSCVSVVPGARRIQTQDRPGDADDQQRPHDHEPDDSVQEQPDHGAVRRSGGAATISAVADRSHPDSRVWLETSTPMSVPATASGPMSMMESSRWAADIPAKNPRMPHSTTSGRWPQRRPSAHPTLPARNGTTRCDWNGSGCTAPVTREAAATAAPTTPASRAEMPWSQRDRSRPRQAAPTWCNIARRSGSTLPIRTSPPRCATSTGRCAGH